MGVAEVVQPDHRQPLLPQRSTRPREMAGEVAGEPLRVPMGAVEVAEHERRVAHEIERQQSASGPVGTKRGHGAGVQVDNA